MRYFYFVSFVAYREEGDPAFSNACCEANGPLDNEESITALEEQFTKVINAKVIGAAVTSIKFISFQLLRTEEEN